MNKESNPRLSQNIGYLVGCFVSVVALIVFFAPGQASLQSLGPANTGHEALACQSCHVEAPGTIRQQLQANARYYLGLRQTQPDFVHQAVTNDNCIACHDKPNDSHPPHRFLEPRFAEARVSLRPEYCVSCHMEHQGKRVTTVGLEFCSSCHQDMELQNDPLTVPHDELVQRGDWESCLGCHDYHNNHDMEVETVVGRAIKPRKLIEYYNGHPSPYPGEIIYKAKESIDE